MPPSPSGAVSARDKGQRHCPCGGRFESVRQRLAGEPAKFGGSLGIAAGSTNSGVIGPQAFYAPTAVWLTANGAAFTGGAVQIAIHCLLPVVPQA
jgi:hypothetical protein